MSIIIKTNSICPVCFKQIEAAYVNHNGKVYLEKECKEHGEYRVIVAENETQFLKWNRQVTNIPPKSGITARTEKGCPLDCGTCEEHLQTACCVLLDVTSRCNQKCPYCFASADDNKDNDPTLSEIEKWYDALIDLGEERPFNIQLSGGEPTVRDDLEEIIAMGVKKGFTYIQLNTNGRRLGLEDNYGHKLKKAGISAVFLQFDGLDDEINQKLRGEPLLELKIKAIENCKKAGIAVALVPTIVKGVNDTQIGTMISFMLEHLDVIKGIHFQPVSYFGRYPKGENGEICDDRMTMFMLINEMEKQTKGMIQSSQLYPLSTGHNLCCFYGSFLKEKDGSITSLVSEEDELGCDCHSPISPKEIIQRDRDFVLEKWELPTTTCCCCENSHETESMDGFDAFIHHLKTNCFTLTGMAFQDVMNLDSQRVSRCRVQVFSPGESGHTDRLIPFCAYNITSLEGKPLYRKG